MLAFKDNIDCPHGVGPEGTCPLLAQCQSPGLPTRPADFGTTGRDIAILVIGEAPGYYEDRASKSWVGVSGDLLHRLLAAAKLPDRADIFLANAVRCHPLGNDKPGNRVLTTCRAHLEDDMQQLAAHYKTVYVLCTGAPAAFAAGHKTLKAAFSFQGYETEWFPGLSFRTFFTYHPAHLLPGKDKAKGRSPSHVRAVGDHLEFLWEVVTGKRVVRDSIIQPERRPPPPDPLPDIVAIDIETYGILKHFNQTVFHPRKSEVIDGIRRGAQIVTVALSWEDKPCTPSNLSPPTSGSQPSSSNSSSCSSCSFAGGTRERHAVFIWADARDRKILYEWMRRLESQGKTLLGKNILFDLMYLRYNSPVFRYWLDCTKRLRLEDIGVWNHLDYELRPEKSLKPLAELLGVASYGSLLVNAKDPAKRASSPYDPNLHVYNATDTASTLRARAVLITRIRERYSFTSTKLSPVCLQFHNELLWSTLYMAEAGLPFDLAPLRALETKYRAQMEVYEARAKADYDLTMKGKGSQGSLRSLFYAIIEEYLGVEVESQVEFTPKTREVCLNDNNINLFLHHLPAESGFRPAIELLRDYREISHKVSSFLNPLLNDPRKGVVETATAGSRQIGFAYPSWHIIPTGYEGKGQDSDEGKGTIQGRITCTRPPAQTDPPWVKAHMTSRHERGVILVADESQLELRVAGLLSGDPVLMDAYRQGRDLHTDLAARLFPDIPQDHEWWKSVYRQAGKRGRFNILFRGGGGALQRALKKDVGHLVDVEALFPLDLCDAIVITVRKEHPVLWAWQDRLIAEVGRKGYLETCTGWGRTFSGGERIVRDTYMNEICNCPVQTTAAQLVQSAQYQIQRELVRRHLRTVIDLNVYDAVRLDCPPEEEAEALEIIKKPLTNPPLLAIIQEAMGREMPLTYEVKRVQVGA